LTRHETELSVLPEPTFYTEISTEVNDELERHLAGDYSETKISSNLLFDGSDSGDIRRRSLESIFNCSPESEADSGTEALSSCSKRRDFDHTFCTGTDYHEYRLPHDPQVIELCDLSSDIDIDSEAEDFPLSPHLTVKILDVRFEDRTSISYCEDVEPTELSTPLSISLSDSQSERESITDLFIELSIIPPNSMLLLLSAQLAPNFTPSL
jgi:hypothetical protein